MDSQSMALLLGLGVTLYVATPSPVEASSYVSEAEPLSPGSLNEAVRLREAAREARQLTRVTRQEQDVVERAYATIDRAEKLKTEADRINSLVPKFDRVRPAPATPTKPSRNWARDAREMESKANKAAPDIEYYRSLFRS